MVKQEGGLRPAVEDRRLTTMTTTMMMMPESKRVVKFLLLNLEAVKSVNCNPV